MRQFFDWLDAADPIVLVAVLGVLCLFAIALEWHLQRQRLLRATEYLSGYDLGYRDGIAGRMPAFLSTGRRKLTELPESFRRGYQ